MKNFISIFYLPLVFAILFMRCGEMEGDYAEQGKKDVKAVGSVKVVQEESMLLSFNEKDSREINYISLCGEWKEGTEGLKWVTVARIVRK